MQTLFTPIIKTTKRQEVVFIMPVIEKDKMQYSLRIKKPDKPFEVVETSKDLERLKRLLEQLFNSLN